MERGAATAGTVREALGAAADALAAAGVESPRLDAELLLVAASGWTRAQLASEPERGIPAAEARRFGESLRRRLAREPVAYIVGLRCFRSLELAVDHDVLIPRPETELLVEVAVERRPQRVLDIGTGSGAVALAIAAELPGCTVTATDTSAGALRVAAANARRLRLADRVELVEGMVPDGPERYDLTVANLPYVAEPEFRALPPEIAHWEPREALIGGPDGLDVLRKAIPAAAGLAPAMALEVGAGQAPAVAEMLAAVGLGSTEARADLAGIPRVVLGTRGGQH